MVLELTCSFTMAWGSHVNMQVPGEQVCFEWNLAKLFDILTPPSDEEELALAQKLIQVNVSHPPLELISEFIDEPFSPSRNAISGQGGVLPVSIELVQSRLTDGFLSECVINGRHVLPAPLSIASVKTMSMSTYVWQGFLRIKVQSFAMLRNGNETWKACRPSNNICTRQCAWTEARQLRSFEG